jgi:hypothetical protein
MELENESAAARIEKLVGSLELVTARMIGTAVVNSQLASSQTPEMRELFDTWINYMSDEVERFFAPGQEVRLEEISNVTGLSRESVLTLLVSLDRRGRITIGAVCGEPGDGKNRDICDCMLQ